jgi:hypothetical protein
MKFSRKGKADMDLRSFLLAAVLIIIGHAAAS